MQGKPSACHANWESSCEGGQGLSIECIRGPGALVSSNSDVQNNLHISLQDFRFRFRLFWGRALHTLVSRVEGSGPANSASWLGVQATLKCHLLGLRRGRGKNHEREGKRSYLYAVVWGLSAKCDVRYRSGGNSDQPRMRLSSACCSGVRKTPFRCRTQPAFAFISPLIFHVYFLIGTPLYHNQRKTIPPHSPAHRQKRKHSHIPPQRYLPSAGAAHRYNGFERKTVTHALCPPPHQKHF